MIQSVSRIEINKARWSISTTFELKSIFGGNWGSIENWLEPKIEPPLGNLAFPNRETICVRNISKLWTNMHICNNLHCLRKNENEIFISIVFDS